MTPIRRVIGIVALLTLALIGLGVAGVEPGLPRVGGGSGGGGAAPLNGVKAVAASMLLRVGAGAPPGGQLGFMAVEPGGNLVVTDVGRGSVLRFDATGHLLSEWGPQFGGVQLTEPAGVAVAGDSYYVLDRGTPRIFRLDSSGQPQAMLDLGPLSTYGLNGLAVDAAGNIYAADTGRNRILVFSSSGQLIKQVGHGGNDLGGFTQPMMIAFALDGSFYVADWENSRIERFDPAFNATDAWSTGFHAFGVAVDQAGRVYAPDFDHRLVEAYTPQGAELGQIGSPGSPVIDLAPKQVAMAPTGPPSLYVLGTDGIERVDLADTPPPPQGGGAGDSDVISVLALVLILVVVGLAVVSRRRRRRTTASFHAPLEGPVGLHPENGAQRKQQQARADEDLLIAHQPERKQ